MATELRDGERARQADQKSAVAARQGVISGRVILVLITSLFLSIVALVIGFWAVH